ncbi:jerky protein [Biomphalaria glabrata]|nr:jerky protein [Biomphalaria glabrata]
MVRTYHRKTQRGSYGLQNLTEALKAIADGMPLNTVSETFKIPVKTLRRHRDTKVQNPGSLVLGRYRSDFSKDQELDLVELITKMEQSLFGLSTLDTKSGIWMKLEFQQYRNQSKIIGSKGTRQVGRVTSAERGQTVTVLCAMNAAGTYIPPIFIFPRKRMVDSLMNGCVPASKGLCTPSGWTDSECFINWLKHLAAFVKPKPNDKHLILLDGHHSHKTLEAVNFARENGIELLTFPPHCTHKLQPLNRTFFKSLKSACNASSDSWMSCHKGRRITSYEVVSIFSKAYVKVATIEKAMLGFCCTDKCCEGPSASTSKTMLDEIIGPVRAATPRVRKRAAEKATLLTASPFKKRLEEKKIVRSKVGGAASQTTKKGKGKAAKQTVPAVTPCSSCFENYYDDTSGQTWIQCQNCQLWYHNSCQGLEENFVGSFFCIVCDDE